MEAAIFLIGVIVGGLLGTFLEHYQAKQPGHYE